MTTKYFNLYFYRQDPVSVSEEKFRFIEPGVTNREDRMVRVGDRIFSLKDVRYVKAEHVSDYQQDQPTYPEISDEQRQENLHRLGVLRSILFSNQQTEWVNPYSDPFLSTLKREELQAFDQEFFDVPLSDHAARVRAIARWLPFHRGKRDPRQYRREVIVQEVKRPVP